MNAGAPLASQVIASNDLVTEYVKHLSNKPRSNDGVIDIGAFELEDGQIPDLVISTASLPSGTAGTAYSGSIAATGGAAPYQWQVVSGGLPPGVTLSQSSGALSGTPTTAGSFTFGAQVTDAQVPADTATRTLSISIAAAPPPPPPPASVTITTTSLSDARRNKNYSATLAATGGTPPVRLESGGGHAAAGTVVERCDRRHQRSRDNARYLRVYGSGARQSIDAGGRAESALDRGPAVAPRNRLDRRRAVGQGKAAPPDAEI